LTAGGLSELQRRALSLAQSSGKRLISMVETILDIGRLEAGAMPVEPERLALDALVDEALEMERPLTEPRKLVLSRSGPKGLPDAWADRSLTMRVLLNLIGNAIKFTPAGG